MVYNLTHAIPYIETDASYSLDFQLDIAGRTPYFFRFTDESALSAILTRPNPVFVESSRRRGIADALEYLNTHNAEFAVVLNSAMASQPYISRLLVQAINNRFGLELSHSANLQTCLQEALSNSLIHGNLCISSKCETLDDFDRFNNTLAYKLEDPHYIYMHIYILIWNYGRSLKIELKHEGQGRISDQHIVSTHPLLHSKSGRGLYLIQTLADQVWCNDNGKSLYFSIPV